MLTPPFGQSAQVYDALCRRKDYAAASVRIREIVHTAVPHATSLLDVGCGTGRHLQHLREYYRVEGLDRSHEMLEGARQRCPDIPFHEATLIDFQLARRFDVVTCLFGSIGYAVTVENLRRAVQCMAGHLSAGGALIVEPWVSPERFVTGRLVFDAVDDPDLKVARMYVTRCEGRISIFESDYLVATTERVTHFRERQELGLFTDEEYRHAFAEAGLVVVDASSDLFGYGLYVCLAKSSKLK